VIAHGHHLGDNGLTRPIDTKDLCKLLQIVCRCLTDGEDSVTEPAHTEGTQLLIEELDTQLARQQRDVLDDGQANTPLLVLR